MGGSQVERRRRRDLPLLTGKGIGVLGASGGRRGSSPSHLMLRWNAYSPPLVDVAPEPIVRSKLTPSRAPVAAVELVGRHSGLERPTAAASSIPTTDMVRRGSRASGMAERVCTQSGASELRGV